jgi:hypothetical protein
MDFAKHAKFEISTFIISNNSSLKKSTTIFYIFKYELSKRTFSCYIWFIVVCIHPEYDDFFSCYLDAC